MSRLIPEPARQRIAVKKWEALADGVCDAAAAIVIERRRPAELQSDEWIERQRRKIDDGVAELSRELDERAWCHGEALFARRHRDRMRARLSRPCATPSSTGGRRYPNLARLADKLGKRPSFADTQPPAALTFRRSDRIRRAAACE